MTTAEKIIEKILSNHPEVSREEILKSLDEEKKRTDGLISDEVLLRMIATEFGVEISKEALKPKLSVQDLVPGLNDVTVVGRVVAVFSPRTFKGPKEGKVASLLIVDENDILRVVLWDDKTSLVGSEKMKVGDIIRFSHGYTRRGYSRRVELHLGDRSEIQVDPENVKAEDYPTISKFMIEIAEITSKYKNRRVNIFGHVKELFPVSNFKRNDSSSGKVMRFNLADETAEISAVAWNEKVDEIEKMLKKGVGLQVVNAKVKKATSEGLEIHINSETYVETIKPTERFSKIEDLKVGTKHVNVKGVVVTEPMLRNLETSRGELVKLSVFEVKDESGRIWVSAWRNHADAVSDLKMGDKIAIKDAYVKRGFGDQLEISTRNATSLVFFPKGLENDGENQN